LRGLFSFVFFVELTVVVVVVVVVVADRPPLLVSFPPSPVFSIDFSLLRFVLACSDDAPAPVVSWWTRGHVRVAWVRRVRVLSVETCALRTTDLFSCVLGPWQAAPTAGGGADRAPPLGGACIDGGDPTVRATDGAAPPPASLAPPHQQQPRPPDPAAPAAPAAAWRARLRTKMRVAAHTVGAVNAMEVRSEWQCVSPADLVAPPLGESS